MFNFLLLYAFRFFKHFWKTFEIYFWFACNNNSKHLFKKLRQWDNKNEIIFGFIWSNLDFLSVQGGFEQTYVDSENIPVSLNGWMQSGKSYVFLSWFQDLSKIKFVLLHKKKICPCVDTVSEIRMNWFTVRFVYVSVLCSVVLWTYDITFGRLKRSHA